MATTKRKTKATRRRKQPITPEDLQRFVWVSEPRISPDGETVVFVRKHVGEKNEYVTNLWIVDAEGGEPRPFTAGGRDRQPRWSPDGSTLAFVRQLEGEGPQVWLIDAHGGEARQLTSFPEGSLGSYAWSPDGTRLAVRFRETHPDWTEAAKKEREQSGLSTPPRVIDDWYYRLDGDGYFLSARHALYLVDAADGAARELFAKDRLGEFSFSFSPDGKQLAVTANRDRKALVKPWATELFRVDVRTGKARPVPNLPVGNWGAVSWSPDGKSLAFAGTEGADRTWGQHNSDLWVCDPVKGRARNLTGKDDYCMVAAPISDMAEAHWDANAVWSRDGKRLYLGLGWHGQGQVGVVERRGGRVRMLTEGDHVIEPGNLSDDGERMACTVTLPGRPAEVHVAEVGRDRFDLRRLTDVNGALLKEREVARARSHWVRAADGHPVQVWEMRPVGADDRRTPAVLEVHGGPHGQYGVGFFHEFQVLAAQGYTVFFSNPRGSKGYGEEHCAAIGGDWGHHDWADVQAVIGFMRSRPHVDPERMGIMGGSYGGYMTNWAISHTDVFAGAITDRCVSNMVSMVGSSDIMEPPDGYWQGNAWDRPESLWDQSPLKYLGAAKTPTLIIHSEGDLRCNVEQGEQVFAALKHRNVPTRFVRYPPGTSHGMSRMGPPDMRVHRLHQILEWWARWLKGRR